MSVRMRSSDRGFRSTAAAVRIVHERGPVRGPALPWSLRILAAIDPVDRTELVVDEVDEAQAQVLE